MHEEKVLSKFSPEANAGKVEQTSDDFSKEEKVNRLVNGTWTTLVWIPRARRGGVLERLLVHRFDNLLVLEGCRPGPGGRRGKGSVNKERLPRGQLSLGEASREAEHPRDGAGERHCRWWMNGRVGVLLANQRPVVSTPRESPNQPCPQSQSQSSRS